MATETNVQNLKINTMTQAQYATITPSATELYMVTDSGSNYAFNNMSNVDSTGKKAVDNWGCPNYSAGISMGLPTYPTSETTTTYTCPSAGIGKFWLFRAAVGYNVDIYVNNINVWSASALSAFGLTALIPLSKDDVVLVKTNGTSNTWEVATAFYPLKGEA